MITKTNQIYIEPELLQKISIIRNYPIFGRYDNVYRNYFGRGDQSEEDSFR